MPLWPHSILLGVGYFNVTRITVQVSSEFLPEMKRKKNIVILISLETISTFHIHCEISIVKQTENFSVVVVVKKYDFFIHCNLLCMEQKTTLNIMICWLLSWMCACVRAVVHMFFHLVRQMHILRICINLNSFIYSFDGSYPSGTYNISKRWNEHLIHRTNVISLIFEWMNDDRIPVNFPPKPQHQQ